MSTSGEGSVSDVGEQASTRDAVADPSDGADEAPDDEEHTPKGTLVIVSAFLLITALVWIWTFYLLDIWG